ncbi:hypothetical protein [Microvirga massiliensis]|uniref:hypothetical protein n=1 Tax=Microvirga massiliensis TaxID=1033741 RepID=UPI00062BCB3E|nr:hypothetical protein [Microvirga massiliensis]
MKVAITHPELGIYVGNCMGLGFWSLLDAVGQDCAVVFDTEEEARRHVSSWDERNAPDDYGYAAVEVADDAHYATVDDLSAAGLDELVGELAA